MSDLVIDVNQLGRTSFVEVWQNQQYWPINGWDAQKSRQYSTIDFENASDKFPVIDLPPGWDWDGDWELDEENRYGEVDSEGFCYAMSNEKCLESLRAKSSVGVSSSSTMVRRRCYVRPKVCSTEAGKLELKRQLEAFVVKKSRLDISTKDKRAEIQSVVVFEQRREDMYNTILFRAGDVINSTSENLKSILQKLSLLRTFLTERSALEREYSRKLEYISMSYRNADVYSSGDPRAATSEEGNIERNVQPKILQELNSWDQGATCSTVDVGGAGDVKTMATSFFGSLSSATQAISERTNHFGLLLAEGMLEGMVINVCVVIYNWFLYLLCVSFRCQWTYWCHQPEPKASPNRV